MNRVSHGAASAAPDRAERVQRWAAVLLTALLHVLLVLLVMQPPTPITLTTPQGRAGGSGMEVTLFDESLSQAPPEPEPPVHKSVPRKKPQRSRVIPRPPATPVMEASMPMPPKSDTPDTQTQPAATEPEPPDTTERPYHVPGQPPGMGRDDNARANAALAAKLGGNRGRSDNAAPIGANMGVDGFHVYYELVNEDRLRAWRDQGMTELFLPLPGTLRLMVCPLEVALHRGSGACRMIDMDSPELKSIGDARDVINIQRVYQLGDMVWSGPGPYR